MTQFPTRLQRPRNIYIDVDGVCLRGADSVAGIEPALYVFEFLRWTTEFHRPHWLTTRDAHGQHEGILRAFKLAIGSVTLPTEIEALLKSIRQPRGTGAKFPVSTWRLTSFG
jgi:hypothetical protein